VGGPRASAQARRWQASQLPWRPLSKRGAFAQDRGRGKAKNASRIFIFRGLGNSGCRCLLGCALAVSACASPGRRKSGRKEGQAQDDDDDDDGK